MLHKCANPECNRPFRYLRQGKLFQVETEYFEADRPGLAPRRNRAVRRVEHYWLCDDCASVLTLISEKGRGMIAVPRQQIAVKKPMAAVRLGPSRTVLEFPPAELRVAK